MIRLIFMLFIYVTVSGCSTRNIGNGYKFSKLYFELNAENTDVYSNQFQWDANTFYLINIKEPLNFYINDKLAYKYIPKTDSVRTSKKKVADFNIKNNNQFKNVKILLTKSRRMVEFVMDPKIPFYDLFYNDECFYIYGYQGDVKTLGNRLD